MYDLDGDDKIARDELLAVLHMMVGDNISECEVTLSDHVLQREGRSDAPSSITFADHRTM